MPLPTPNKNEEKAKFISRCAGNPVMNKEYKDQKQRLAICFSQWKKAHPNSKASIDFFIDTESHIWFF